MIKTIPKVDNHTEIAQGYLLEQYKNRPNIEALLKALILPVQELEDTLYIMYLNLSIFAAESFYLYRIGAIIGEKRNYKNDSNYKLALFTRIVANNSGGTPEEIIAIIRSVFNSNKVEYSEYGDASFQVYIETSQSINGINSLLANMKPVGVNIPVVLYSDTSNVLRMSERTSEIGEFSVNTTNGKDDMVLQDTGVTTTLVEISFDSFANPYSTLGFGEMITTKTKLALEDGSEYMIDNAKDINLETIVLSQLEAKDYFIEGGSSLSEVIQNGG